MKNKVLVVDDCRETREQVREILENRGCEVSTAADGYDAVLQFESDKPDLLITELKMPGMDGYDLCRIIRAFSSMPIVILTGQRGVEEVFKALKAGADAFVPRPLDEGKFLAEIEALLTVYPNPAVS